MPPYTATTTAVLVCAGSHGRGQRVCTCVTWSCHSGTSVWTRYAGMGGHPQSLQKGLLQPRPLKAKNFSPQWWHVTPELPAWRNPAPAPANTGESSTMSWSALSVFQTFSPLRRLTWERNQATGVRLHPGQCHSGPCGCAMLRISSLKLSKSNTKQLRSECEKSSGFITKLLLYPDFSPTRRISLPWLWLLKKFLAPHPHGSRMVSALTTRVSPAANDLCVCWAVH